MSPSDVGEPQEQPQSKSLKLRQDARRYVDALASRLVELESLAQEASVFASFEAGKYAQFKRLFVRFSELCEEFQVFSRITEEALANVQNLIDGDPAERTTLDDAFRRLQVPMLHAVIKTNLRLLHVWEDRLQRGEGLPIGAYELLAETARIIQHTRGELLRPRYAELLDDTTIADGAEADQLVRSLIAKAPRLSDFANSPPTSPRVPNRNEM
jgi:hypothetical protein